MNSIRTNRESQTGYNQFFLILFELENDFEKENSEAGRNLKKMMVCNIEAFLDLHDYLKHASETFKIW